MSFFGHLLLFTPLIRVISWIPLVGWLLVKVLNVAVFIFSLVWSLLLHFLVLGTAWIVYRPCYGACLLACFGVCFYFVLQGGGVDPAAV